MLICTPPKKMWHVLFTFLQFGIPLGYSFSLQLLDTRYSMPQCYQNMIMLSVRYLDFCKSKSYHGVNEIVTGKKLLDYLMAR